MSDPARGTVRIVKLRNERGRRAARFSLGESQSACEVLHKRGANLGRDEYYGLELRFPRDWRDPGPWGAVVAQFNYPALMGPPVGLFVHANRLDIVVLAGLVTWDGCSGPNKGCDGRAQYNNTDGMGHGGTAIPAPMRLGVWHQLIVHVRWATDARGVVDVWHRERGQPSWRRMYHVDGEPTMQWAPCCLTASGTNPDGTSRPTADKTGLFRAPNGRPVYLWNAGFFSGRDFYGVAQQLD